MYYRRRDTTWPWTVAIAATLTLAVPVGIRIYEGVKLEQEITGHLKLAADANTTAQAERRLEMAIEGMDSRGVCPDKGDCFTSVLWRTPDEDVAFWRGNIESTYDDLRLMSDEDRASNLVESNQLIKVRETLLDAGEGGDHVTAPRGLSVYPSNAFFAWWTWLALAATAFGWMWVAKEA